MWGEEGEVEGCGTRQGKVELKTGTACRAPYGTRVYAIFQPFDVAGNWHGVKFW